MARIMGASRVWLTEQPELIRIINVNIEANFGSSSSSSSSSSLSGLGGITTESLYWSRENAQRFRDVNGCPDFVVCCDCIYEPFWGDSYRALLDCMDLLCEEGGVGIISVERRNADGVDKFLELARGRMEVRHVMEDHHLKWHIYELRHHHDSSSHNGHNGHGDK